MRNRFVFLFLLLFLSACFVELGFAQSFKPQLFPVSQLRADFDEVVKITEMHPARYFYTSREEFDKMVAARRAMIDRELTIAEFMTVCAPVVEQIRCGHSGFEIPASVWEKKGVPLFPMPVMIINDSLVVKSDFSRTRKGTVITMINGKPFYEILKVIMTYISADGFNTTWKTGRLNQNLNKHITTYFNFPEQYEIVTSVEGQAVISSIQSISNSALSQMSQAKSSERLSYQKLGTDNVGVIRIADFGFYNKQNKIFNTTMDGYFSKVQSDGIENLIVDLRGNTGGDPYCSAYLLSYLLKEPFQYYETCYDWGMPLCKSISPKPNSFKGNVYALIDGLCFSTTGAFAAFLKTTKRAIFIGEETGGTFVCNDSGKWFDLKNTGLRLRMARQTFAVTADQLKRDRGIFPDHDLKPEISAVLGEQDRVLDYALALIKGR